MTRDRRSPFRLDTSLFILCDKLNVRRLFFGEAIRSSSAYVKCWMLIFEDKMILRNTDFRGALIGQLNPRSASALRGWPKSNPATRSWTWRPGTAMRHHVTGRHIRPAIIDRFAFHLLFHVRHTLTKLVRGLIFSTFTIANVTSTWHLLNKKSDRSQSCARNYLLTVDFLFESDARWAISHIGCRP